MSPSALWKRVRRNFDASRFLESEHRFYVKMLYEYMTRLSLACTESGISAERYCDHEIIVSLTSYGRRILDVPVAIESIMQGSVKPNRIVLWLAEDEFRSKSLPVMLQKQQDRGLEVAFCKDTRSYKKLIPSLKKYPDATIITVDDDVIYEADFLENLLLSYKEHPDCIAAYRTGRIVLTSGKGAVGFTIERGSPQDGTSFANYFTGIGGVLYPAHCLSDEIFNEDVYLTLMNDDNWFYAMALLKGTKTTRCNGRNLNGCNFVDLPEWKETPLQAFNGKMRRDGIRENDAQLKAVFDRYNLWDKLRV